MAAPVPVEACLLDMGSTTASRPHGRDLRKGRFSEANRTYHLTTTTLHRQPVFNDPYAARVLIRALRAEEERGRAHTLAFVVMPDHLHWLVELADSATLASVVGDVKSVTAHRLGGHLWQAGYYDHALRRDEDVRTLERYMIANPLRAGLVERLGDYPHWDAIWL